MSQDAMPALPEPDDRNEWAVPLWDEDSLRAYAAAVARAARADERAKCIAGMEAEADGFRGVRQWQAVVGIMACIDALRARSEAKGGER